MRAVVMGVLNVTPDSFSDGGRYVDFPAAVARGLTLFAEGAAIVDVGGESSRPGAAAVSVDEELERTIPVVAALVGTGKGRVSIDTTKREVAEAAIGAGATLVNDITGELWPVAAEAGVGWVAMHKQGTPLTMQVDPHYDDVVAEVLDWCVRRATLARSAGVTEVWIDPGLGFGKRREHNLSLLGHVRRFVDSGYPVLIGASRKTFLGDVTTFRGQTSGPNERFEASLAAACWALSEGANMVRVHDVAAAVQAVRLVHETVPWASAESTVRGAA